MTETIRGERIKEVSAIVGRMDMETFIHFTQELQYAYKWYLLGIEVAGQSIMFNEGEHQSEAALEANVVWGDKVEGIRNSVLYQAVRERVEEITGGGITDEWTGWFGLESQYDVLAIEAEIKVQHRKNMPIVGLIGAGVGDAAVEMAKKKIEGFGIRGVFVQDPDADMVEVFLREWGK